MNFHVLTLFPEMIQQGMNTSIIGRAITGGYLSVEAINIRDYAFNKHQKVDDYPYGGFTKCCERTGCAALHVRCAASVHAVTLDAGAPRIFHAGGRDDVDVPREHEFRHARFAAAGSGEQHWVGRFREENADVGLDAR